MSNVKWIKLATDLFEDEKILLLDTEPDADALIVLCVKLLCLAGKQNHRGIFEMSNGVAYTTEMLAMFFRRPPELVERALEIFQRYGMVDITEGRVSIPNWEKHQSLDALERKREYQKNLMRRMRSQRKETPDAQAEDCEANCEANVSSVDKNREEEKREEKIKKEKREADKKNCFEEFAAEDPELLEALSGFEAMRKAIRKPMTERAKRLLLTRLQKYPPGEWVAMLDQAVMNSWLNVYPLQEEGDGGQGKGYRGTGFARGSAANELENFYAMTAEWAEERGREQ